MQPSPDDGERITTYLNIHAEPVPSDLAFVFGTRVPDPAHTAADLVRQGMATYVVLTGGVHRCTGANEAQTHLEILLRAGVPRNCILVEDESTNTLENVRFALPKIEAVLGLSQVQRVIVVAKWYHCRRAMMTLKSHMPQGMRYFTCTYAPNGIDHTNWHLDDEGRSAVLGNWHAIPTYLRRGHLAEIAWDADAFT